MKITEKDGLYYFRLEEGRNLLPLKVKSCVHCSYMLQPNYVYIIHKLKRAKLLPEDYEGICCVCNMVFTAVGHIFCDSCHGRLSVDTRNDHILLSIGKPCRFRYIYCGNSTCKMYRKEVWKGKI